MARAIDVEALEKKISEWLGQPGNGDYYSGYDAALCAVQDLIADTPTLTPQNGCVSRLRELDELYTKLHAVTGFTVEQLLEMFAAGYTLEKHDYSKSFEEMASLLEYEKEHANAYYEECGQWEAENTQLKEKLEALKQDRDFADEYELSE